MEDNWDEDFNLFLDGLGLNADDRDLFRRGMEPVRYLQCSLQAIIGAHVDMGMAPGMAIASLLAASIFHLDIAKGGHCLNTSLDGRPCDQCLRTVHILNKCMPNVLQGLNKGFLELRQIAREYPLEEELDGM